MGRRRCIAFGCKARSTQGVNKGEEVHFFPVPKDSINLWQRALSRKDIVVKLGHSVCQKHFREKDILWRKELRAPDGRVLGVSADYKTPKLRTGAVPSLFLGTTPEETSETEIEDDSEWEAEEFNSKGKVRETKQNIDDTIKINNIDTRYHNDHCYTMNTINNVKVNLHSKIANEKFILNNNSQQKEVEAKNNEPVKDIIEVPAEIEEIPVFEIIYLNEKSVVLPLGWSRQNMKYLSKRMVHFSQFFPRMENGMIEPICTKQVLVDENLEISIFIMRQKIEKENSNVNKESLTSIEDLERLLEFVSRWKLCPGISMSNNEEVQTTSVHRDKDGVYRSIKCSLYMPESSRSGRCEWCNTSKKVILRKATRIKEGYHVQRFRNTLSLPQQQKFDEMRKNMRTLQRGRNRALARIKLLKEQRLRDLQEYKASQSTLEELILESNITGNQRLVILEIMSTSKQTDTRARRYSKTWISFCLMLHRRSPVTYRFLRANNILPLPAPRTVLKFAQRNPAVNDLSGRNGKIDTIEKTIEDVILEGADFVPEDEIPNVEMETEVT